MNEVTAPARRRGFSEQPVLALGFRPFYLLAGMFALVALPLWIAAYLGLLHPGGYLTGVPWHSHEMVFGFASAVIAGFLLTAVRNWTGQPTPTGAMLAGLAGLWILARVVALTGPGSVMVAADLAFFPVLGLAIGVPIWRSRNTRNYKILLVLLALTLANAAFHLANLGLLPDSIMRTATIAALDIITVLMAVVGGRVIPAFISNAIAASNPRRYAMLEFVAMASLLLILGAGILDIRYSLPGMLWMLLLAIAALAHTLRWLLWQPHTTWKDPLLWMLPVAYLWIPVSLALRAWAAIGAIPPSVAVHALTLGAISGLMMAMMMRSALGHTGRALKAGPFEVGAFLLVQVAAIVRLSAGFVIPQNYQHMVVLSGVLWALGFAVFLVRYMPMLSRARLDGKPG